MAILLKLYFVISVCIVGVIPRNFQSEESAIDLELTTQNFMKSKTKGTENVIWTRLESIPDQNLRKQTEGNISGKEKNLTQPSSELEHFPEHKETVQTLAGEIETSRSWSEQFDLQTKSESEGTNEGVENDQSNGHAAVNLTEGSISETEEDFELVKDLNFSENVLNTFNVTGNIIDLHSFSENSSAIQSFPFDKTTLSEEVEIALFQDVSTVGFEFLIDSETMQSLILTELLSTESTLITEEGENEFLIYTMDEDSDLETEGSSLVQDLEMELNINSSIIVENVSFTETEEILMNATESENSSGNTITSKTTEAECPAPGFCMFWFFAQHSCAENSDCLGSGLCCRLGCSKVCLDAR